MIPNTLPPFWIETNKRVTNERFKGKPMKALREDQWKCYSIKIGCSYIDSTIN